MVKEETPRSSDSRKFRQRHTLIPLLGFFQTSIVWTTPFQFKRRRSNRISFKIPSFTVALHSQRHASRYSHYKRHQEFCERLCPAFQLTGACSKSECNTAINRGCSFKSLSKFREFRRSRRFSRYYAAREAT